MSMLDIVSGEGFRTVSRFMEWMKKEKNIDFYEVTDDEDRIILKPDDLVDEYFDLDRNELDKERRALLDKQREMNRR